MKFLDNFFHGSSDNSSEDMTGGAANLSDSDFTEDDDFFMDIESWGERIGSSK